MTQNPWRNIAKLAKRRVLVVNNSKNLAHDAKSLAKHSKVAEEAGSCCNHSQNPGEGEGDGRCYAVYSTSCLLGDEPNRGP